MKSHPVRISPDVERRLAELAIDGETPNAVLRRLLGLAPTQTRFSEFKIKVLSRCQ